MGPHGEPYPQAGPAERYRPQVAIVSSAEIFEQGTLSADYWVTRQPGESWTAWRVRKQVELLEARAKRYDDLAAKARAEADQLREQS
jgi:hypothetical protein